MVLHPNDDDPAVAAPEPHLPLLNDDVDITEPWPPPKEVIDIIEPKRYCCQNCCPPWPFNNNSYSSDDDSSYGAALPPFSNSVIVNLLSSTIMNNSYSSDDDDIRPKLVPHSMTVVPFNNPPPDQSVIMEHFLSSRIWTKPSSNNNLDLKGHVMVKVRTTPADIIKLENNTRIIPEEEAVCRFCFHLLFPVSNNNNNNNVLKTKCMCPFTLTHDHCATEWSGKKGNTKCDVCDQEINYIPVTLSAPPWTREQKPDKGSFISILKKWSCFTTG